MTRKIKYFLTSLFIIGWLFLFGPSIANADEVTVQVTPADPNTTSETATATTPITVEVVAEKIETAQETLQQAAETQATAIVATIQANVPNTDSQAATTIATTQEPIATAVAEATVKVAEANTAIQSAETAVSVAESATSAVSSATAIVEEKVVAVESAESTKDTAVQNNQVAETNLNTQTPITIASQAAYDSARDNTSSAQTDLNTKQGTLTSATTAVNNQTAIVATDQANVNAAQAVVDANTTPGLKVTIYDSADSGASPTVGEGTVVYTGTDTNGINEQWASGGPTVNGGTTVVTETFAGNKLNTEIGITVNGTPVSTTNNNEVYIGSIGFPGPGQDPSLTLRGSTADTLITMPANTVTASFQVFAKNGDHNAVVTYTDGTTSTFNIQDNVSSTYPNYVHQETITAPTGKTIASINIPANWDYYGVDNVSATKQATTIITEGFQVKWEGIWTPQTNGTQSITAPADDGVILKLDGEVVINDWVDKGGGGSTADVQTTAGTGKTFEMWYYENGGGAAVALKRYNGSTWEVIPGSEFSQSSATPAQIASLNAAKTTLATDTAVLNTLTTAKTTAQNNVNSAQTTLSTAQSIQNTAESTMLGEEAKQAVVQQAAWDTRAAVQTATENLVTAQTNLATAETNLTSAQTNLTIAIHTADSLACLLYTSPSPRDRQKSRMPSSA